MADLGSAYVNIIPKAPGIENELKKMLGDGAAGAGGPAGQKAGSSFLSALKKAIPAAAIGKVIKDAFSAGADLQQSFGGLDTIYGDAAAAAKSYAQSAALAGISANDYAETAVSIGASLKAAFGGDTTAAMEAANTAIMDMTDNAAKMGTPVESIQQAYQGFAKQNYTMLDNLKLGYGGTQAEMQRLLADATKLTGVKYDISNLGDVYSAIHVIQGELGLTGVAAEEAKTTFSGSLNAMKASWTNVMAAMTTGEGLDTALSGLSTSTAAFVTNFLSMGTTLAESIPELMSGVGSALIAAAPELLGGGTEMALQIASGLVSGAVDLVAAIPDIVSSAGEAFLNHEWGGIGGQIIGGIAGGLLSGAGQFLEAIKSVVGDGIAWAKSLLGIQSPSKVFANEVGRWLPAGMAVGIEGNLSPVNKAISRMTDTATAEMNRAKAPGMTASRSQTDGLSQLAASIDNRPVVVKPVIEFTGSLAQLGRVLQPYIKAEEQRRGPQLVK